MAVNTTVEVVMPPMGDSVSEGSILEWHKQEGDSVSEDETLVEISTDKVDAEVPAPVSGTVVKIHAAEGDTVNVGSVLAEIAPGDGAAPALEGDADEDEGDSPPGDDGGGGGEGKVIEIEMPQMGESVSEGTILEWAKAVGDSVAEDETLVEISTDKVDAEVPAPAAGTITELLAEAGDTVTVGQVIARMQSGNGAAPSKVAPKPEATETRPGTDADTQTIETPEGLKVTPVAQRVAAAQGIDLSKVQGTGPNGRIGKADVLNFEQNGATATKSAPAPTSGKQTLLKGASAMLARYMDESRQIPTATSFRTFTVTTLDGYRKQLKGAGQKVSFTHLIAYAIARAATEQMPVMATHFAEIDGKPHVIDDGAVNLGIAVDVEKKGGGRTLMVPVIKDAGRLTFPQFLDAFGVLITKARENKLTADDLQGANVSLTNPGGIGTIASVPRLMNGQGTIVATGAIGYPPGLGAIGATIGAEKVMTMTSTYDHRIIQGAESGQFLQVVEQYLQGEHGFYEQVFSDLGAEIGAAPTAPTPQAIAAATPETKTEPAPATSAEPNLELLQAVQAAMSLIKAHRTHGHLAARLDPLGSEPEGDPALDPEPLGLTPELMAKIPASILRVGVPGETLADVIPRLRETYCGQIAYEIEHIASHRQRVWLREKIETGAFRKPLSADEKQALLRRLTQVDSLERFMHKAYLGQKQFSVEGLDMTVPMIDEMIQLAAAEGAREVVIGMAHRGRLNVLAHNLGRAYETIFREFEGASSIEAVTTIPQGGTGDVKYHHGAQGTYQCGDVDSVLVRLESNPSHLEYVAPVVTGATRAVQTSRQGTHATLDTTAAVPIVLHGDAAFPGQGVVAETFNLQALDGYTVGGTLHLIQNNQVGFTTDPDDSRSTRWASDLAKGFDVPIFHVNADDVAACVSAVRLAFAFRQEFGHDVVVDLIGYRRYGHNEADEPAYTQPEMTAKIKAKKPVRELFAGTLVAEGTITQEEADGVAGEIWDDLAKRHRELKEQLASAGDEQPTGGYELDRSASPDVKTAGLQGAPGNAQRRAAADSRGLHRPSEAGQAARAPAHGDRPGRRHRLGAGRVAGLRVAADRGHAGASDRPGRGARHVLAASPRPARPEDRPADLADPEPAGRTGADGAAQLPAERGRLPRLRVRLLDGGAGDARALGGPVRRLRQLGAGHHRPVHRVGVVQVGPDDPPDAAAAARLRGLGSGTLLRPPGAVPHAGGGGQHPRREPHDAVAVLPHAASPGAGRQAAPAGDHDPEVAPAPAAGDVARSSTSPRAASSRSWPNRGSTRRRSRGWCCARARSTTTSRVTPRARTTSPSRSPASSCCIRSRRGRSSRRSSATRTCARCCGSRRSRATWAPVRTCRRACCRSSPRTSTSGTSAGRSAPRRARATRPRTPSSRRGSSATRSTPACRCRSTRRSCRANAETIRLDR